MVRKFFILTLLFLPIFSLFSVEIIASEKSIKENRTFEKDLIIAGDTVDFSGKGRALYLFGKEVFMRGISSDSLFVGAKYLEVEGDVKNHLYAIGQLINVKGDVAGTSFFFAEEIVIEKNTVFNGSIFAGCATLKIYGTVNGDVYAGAGRIIVNGVINGDVKLDVGNLSINENGKIIGDLFYKSDMPLSPAEIERVGGNKEFKQSNLRHNKEFWKEKSKKKFKVFGIVFSFFMFVSFIICGLLINLFPAAKKFEIQISDRTFWNKLLWGLIPFFIYPAIALLALILGVTIPIGIALIAAAFPLLLLTEIFGVTLFGQFLFRIFKFKKNNRFLFFLFGGVIFGILSVVPFFGFLSLIFFSSIGWGFIIFELFNMSKEENIKIANNGDIF